MGSPWVSGFAEEPASGNGRSASPEPRLPSAVFTANPETRTLEYVATMMKYEGLVATVVQPRKLRWGVNPHFPHPSYRFCEKPLLQTNGLLGSLSVFGRFSTYQILPNFTNFYQKRVANGLERGR